MIYALFKKHTITVYAEDTMNYHINTIPIWDSFKQNCECPICVLEQMVEKQIVSQYLNEAVMEDDYRADVNKKGFCKGHFQQLYAGENKLGLALQTSTRFKELIKKINISGNFKKPKVISDIINKQLSTCIICEVVEFNMERYFVTIPKMFQHEAEFPSLIVSGKGFCLKHFARIINSYKHAGSASKTFLESIAKVQEDNLARLEDELIYFTDKFDYRNHDKPWGTSKDALPRAINKIHGAVIDNVTKN